MLFMNGYVLRGTMTKIDKLLLKEIEKKQVTLFNRGHQGLKNSVRYIQLIDAQDALKRRGRSESKRKKTRRS